MPAIIPHRFLFRFAIPVRQMPRLPKKGKALLDLPAECALPDFGELDGAVPFGQLRAAWNPRGLGLSVVVGGKSKPPACKIETPTESDGLQVWIDTRNTQSIHRAGRFCHHFCCLPAGAGAKGDRPAVLQLPIARAREDAPFVQTEDIPVSVEQLAGGYRLEVWLPAEVLNGFEPESSPRLGFYCYLRDAELGEQFLTVGREFPFAHDPSLWSTLELTP